MAATAVLELPELLETVLINLDVKTLLLSQRANKQWKAIIESSPDLQDKLFFKLKEHRGGDGVDAVNSLLMTRIRHASAAGPSHGQSIDMLLTSLDCLIAFDLSTLPAHASARRMTLSWCEREQYPAAHTEFMECDDDRDHPEKYHDWIIAVAGWKWLGGDSSCWSNGRGKRRKGRIETGDGGY
ncbi:hypothetical protein B0A48_03777 [Cryoendolithus antarcticus]|uniref:F-box domain-containing protein n=1 Tax=Cryoendolithus antarcticus TaxID=1507870 RepID=A0A1V8TGI3_9PEZI|nr:hypothetical protein B0A48_03777 [Cryoendolithus antarcticus]